MNILQTFVYIFLENIEKFRKCSENFQATLVNFKNIFGNFELENLVNFEKLQKILKEFLKDCLYIWKGS